MFSLILAVWNTIKWLTHSSFWKSYYISIKIPCWTLKKHGLQQFYNKLLWNWLLFYSQVLTTDNSSHRMSLAVSVDILGKANQNQTILALWESSIYIIKKASRSVVWIQYNKRSSFNHWGRLNCWIDYLPHLITLLVSVKCKLV